ncbi:hypothetical protein ZHAS_00013065 [Anopheles sinensis]|uniref:Uncharacterized protein n=1 Tax=Anopheles sinensis TaxID=74873 RepID=A0A084W4T5_ANOSI|nr:hypothetical protein ZHAS_00013065 [Anopheles sinensis]
MVENVRKTPSISGVSFFRFAVFASLSPPSGEEDVRSQEFISCPEPGITPSARLFPLQTGDGLAMTLILHHSWLLLLMMIMMLMSDEGVRCYTLDYGLRYCWDLELGCVAHVTSHTEAEIQRAKTVDRLWLLYDDDWTILAILSEVASRPGDYFGPSDNDGMHRSLAPAP